VNIFLGICDLRSFKVCEFLKTNVNELFKFLVKEGFLEKSFGTNLVLNLFHHNNIKALSFLHILERLNFLDLEKSKACLFSI
jgi:hypothetical protein